MCPAAQKLIIIRLLQVLSPITHPCHEIHLLGQASHLLLAGTFIPLTFIQNLPRA